MRHAFLNKILACKVPSIMVLSDDKFSWTQSVAAILAAGVFSFPLNFSQYFYGRLPVNIQISCFNRALSGRIPLKRPTRHSPLGGVNLWLQLMKAMTFLEPF